jgi:hypothetical protein
MASAMKISPERSLKKIKMLNIDNVWRIRPRLEGRCFWHSIAHCLTLKYKNIRIKI